LILCEAVPAACSTLTPFGAFNNGVSIILIDPSRDQGGEKVVSKPPFRTKFEAI